MPLRGTVQIPTVIPAPPSGLQKLLPGAPGLPNYQLGATISLEDPRTGQKTPIASTSQLVKLGNPLTVPVSFNTRGLREDRYNYWLTVQDAFGNILFDNIIFPRAIFLMGVPGFPPVPTLPQVPTGPTAALLKTPMLNLPSSVNFGDRWSGSISIPTVLPSGVPTPPTLPGVPPTLPSFPLTIGVQLETPTGQRFTVAQANPSFQPGQAINIPVSFDTNQLPGPGTENIILSIKDLQGNSLLPGGLPAEVIGMLRVLTRLAPAVPTLPGAPTLPALPGIPESQFGQPGVNLVRGEGDVKIGDTLIVPVVYSHIGAGETRTLRAAIGNALTDVYGNVLTYGFDEILWVEKTIAVPTDADWTTRTENMSIYIGKITTGKAYSVYAKIVGTPFTQKISPTMLNIVTVAGLAAASKFTAVGINLAPSTVKVGDTLIVPVVYAHIGAGETRTIRAEIGQSRFGTFDMILSAEKTIAVPADPDIYPTLRTENIPIYIGSISPGVYSVQAKVVGSLLLPQVIAPTMDNIVTVAAAAAPAAPTAPTTQMIGIPVSSLPTQITQGQTLSGAISLPTRSDGISVPTSPLPVYLGAYLFKNGAAVYGGFLGELRTSFTPGQTLSLPLLLNGSATAALRPDTYDVWLEVSSGAQQLVAKVVARLSLLAAAGAVAAPAPAPGAAPAPAPAPGFTYSPTPIPGGVWDPDLQQYVAFTYVAPAAPAPAAQQGVWDPDLQKYVFYNLATGQFTYSDSPTG